MPLLTQKVIPCLMALLTFNSCLTDRQSCKTILEITTTSHLADTAPLHQSRTLVDFLQRYPQVQVTRVIDNEHSIGFQSRIFYKDILIYTQEYSLRQSKKFRDVSWTGEFPLDTIPLDLNPVVSSEEAIQIARREMDFRDLCIGYRLCIFDLNAGTNLPKSYRLAWLVENLGIDRPMIIIDAVNRGVIMRNGLRP